MKTFVIFLFLLLFVGISNAQDDSLKVAVEDWNFIQETTKELETALDDCDTLNVMYEKRISLFQSEVSNLRMANLTCDTMLTKREEQLAMRKEQIDLLNRKIQKQKIELWATRSVGTIAIIVAAVLILK